MSNQKFAPIRPHFAPEPEPGKAQARNKAPSTGPLTRAEQAQAAALSFEVKVLAAEVESWRGKLERSGIIPSRQEMAWNRDRPRYMPVSPYWLGTPNDTRS